MPQSAGLWLVCLVWTQGLARGAWPYRIEVLATTQAKRAVSECFARLTILTFDNGQVAACSTTPINLCVCVCVCV